MTLFGHAAKTMQNRWQFRAFNPSLPCWIERDGQKAFENEAERRSAELILWSGFEAEFSPGLDWIQEEKLLGAKATKSPSFGARLSIQICGRE